MYFKGERLGKLIIQLAPTGNVPTKDLTPYVPITPDEIADDTYKAVKMGVSSVHIHARDTNGHPTGDKKYYSTIIKKIREKCPNIIICASTSGRFPDGRSTRDEVLETSPDMATLTLGSVNFRDSISINRFEDIIHLATMMKDGGIKPEIEVFEPGFINTARFFAKKGYLTDPMHFNLCLGSLGSIPADIRDLVYLVDSLPENSTWSATGIGRFQTQIAIAAMVMGGHVRIGIEDSLYSDYHNRNPVSNSELVNRIVVIARELGRDIASPGEARQILGLTPVPLHRT
jgi:3-keto-5-aminohexanoate cleavage enzyme